jgi:hypothetical protein
MTDFEFDLLDELYFVTSFQALQEKLAWSEAVLLEQLASLMQKGWIKCLDAQDNLLEFPPADLLTHYQTCLFLASKAGLKAHNSRESD